MADHIEFGKKAEDLAVDFLKKAGYQILVRNYRYLKSEIDIIAVDDKDLVIVEVKARATDAFIEPQEAINKKKMRLLILGANQFSENYEKNLNTRFDVISVLPNAHGQLEIKHIKNAFESIDVI